LSGRSVGGRASEQASPFRVDRLHPELPNPSEGSLFGFCTLPDDGGKNLAEILKAALNYIAWLTNGDPGNDPTRDEILSVAYILDRFANLRTG
jgi:hypothetical protein